MKVVFIVDCCVEYFGVEDVVEEFVVYIDLIDFDVDVGVWLCDLVEYFLERIVVDVGIWFVGVKWVVEVGVECC